jgi:hypothetical protein
MTQGIEMRSVAAASGWLWVVAGYRLFRRSVVNWLALTLLLALLWVVSLVIPVLGPLLFNLLSPVLFAGMMIGCRDLEQNGRLEISHLFSGFRQSAAPLVTVGGVYLVGTILVFGFLFLSADSAKLAALARPGADLEAARAALRDLGPAFALGALAYVPLLMLVWYAPLLVVFDGLAPFAAMKLSFQACLKNTAAFAVYGLALLGVSVVISAPALLGAAGAGLAFALLVASIPVLFCSIYVSYRHIFGTSDPAGTRLPR